MTIIFKATWKKIDHIRGNSNYQAITILDSNLFLFN